MRLVDSSLCELVGDSNPIENASISATNSKVSWRFAWNRRILHLRSVFPFALCLVFAAAILSVSCLAAPLKGAFVRAYFLKQESVLIGPHELYVSADSLRSTDLNTGITTLVIAAHKSVFVFNDKTKCYFQTKIDTMGMDSTITSYTPFRFSLANRTWTKYREFVFCGEKVVVYESFADHRKTAKRSTGTEGVDIHEARYAEATEIKLPPSLLKALEYLYVIPPPKALPLRLIFSSDHSKSNFKQVLKTVSIERKTVPSSFFSLPKSYKQVYKRSQVGDFAKRDAVLESVSDLILEHK